MSCFGYFKKKPRGAPERNSAPAATTSASAAVTASSSGTSRSDGSAAGKQSSASTASTSSQKSIPALYEERAHNLRVFELDELRNATNDFSRMNKIGEGGFGSVYKGYVRNPDERGGRLLVAIKKLNQKGLQGHKQWLAEVQFLAVFEHPNLVKLLGHCAKDGERGIERLLVYEYMPNKSLEDHLFKRAYPTLPWNLRLQIALGVAEGLTYLHEGEVQVLSIPFQKICFLLPLFQYALALLLLVSDVQEVPFLRLTILNKIRFASNINNNVVVVILKLLISYCYVYIADLK